MTLVILKWHCQISNGTGRSQMTLLDLKWHWQISNDTGRSQMTLLDLKWHLQISNDTGISQMALVVLKWHCAIWSYQCHLRTTSAIWGTCVICGPPVQFEICQMYTSKIAQSCYKQKTTLGHLRNLCHLANIKLGVTDIPRSQPNSPRLRLGLFGWDLGISVTPRLILSK